MFNKLNTFIRGLFSNGRKEAGKRQAAVPEDVKTEVTFLHPSGKVRQRDRVRNTFPVTTIEETHKEVKQAAPKMSVRQWIKSVNEYDSIRNKLAM